MRRRDADVRGESVDDLDRDGPPESGRMTRPRDRRGRSTTETHRDGRGGRGSPKVKRSARQGANCAIRASRR